MRREYKTEAEALEVLRSAVWLAWVAAGGPQGMGFMRDNPKADKAAVWKQAYECGDYSGRHPGDGNNLSADYVFGRMLKLRVRRPSPTVLELTDNTPTRDYQSWCGKYPTYAALFDAAEKVAQPQDNVVAK